MIMHSKLSIMKSEILPNCLKGKYGYSLGEFSNMSNVVVGAKSCFPLHQFIQLTQLYKGVPVLCEVWK